MFHSGGAFVKVLFVCFRLALASYFTLISNGTCRTHGLWPINDINECTWGALATVNYTKPKAGIAFPIPGVGRDFPEGCYARIRESNVTDAWMSVDPQNRGNGFYYSSQRGFGRYPICKEAPGYSSSEKGLYCSKHFTAKVHNALFDGLLPNSYADQACLTSCWANPACWGCSAFCSEAGCIWHALEECGELVRALGDNHPYPVSWMPGKAEPVQKSFQKVTWNLLIVVYMLILGTVLMCWLRPWDLVHAWRHLGLKMFNVYAVFVSPLRILRALCIEDPRSDTPIGRKELLVLFYQQLIVFI